MADLTAVVKPKHRLTPTYDLPLTTYDLPLTTYH